MNTGAIARFVLRHKAIVALAWVALLVASIGLMPRALGALSEDFSLQDSESTQANGRILGQFDGVGGIAHPLVLVVDLPEGTTVDDPMVQQDLDRVFGKVAEARPDARIASYASTGDDVFVSEDRGTTYGLVYLPPMGEAGVDGLPEVRAAVEGETVGGAPVQVTGRPALTEVEETSGESAGVLVETLIGAGGALIVLLWVFGSALAILPLIIAAFSILTSFLVIGGIASTVDINTVVQYMVALIGLGIAIDYSLLVVTRWREEHETGLDNQQSVIRAMETAGHAVVFSGTTVGVGLLALVVLPIDMMRGIGIGGLIIPLVSVAATLTLLPVILATVGPRMDWPRNRRVVHHGQGWERWSRGVVKHRWAATVVAVLILGALLIPAVQIQIGEPRPDALGGPIEARAGLEALEESGIDAGVTSPFEIVVDGDPAPVVEALGEVDGLRGVSAPEGDSWRRGQTAIVLAMPQSNGSGSASRDVLGDVREVTHGLDQPVLVGGSMASEGDFVSDTYGQLPLMIAVISVVTLVLLVRAFRSLLLPLKAILLNMLSVAASFGVLVIVWQWGYGSELIWDIPSAGSITSWVPIMAFAFLYGLSMDYEVFILARMREEYDITRDNDDAIVRGLGVTGRLVTSAALILFFAFAAMAAAPATEIKIMATVLAAGILLDATIVRALLVPALVSLMGDWNWWLPSWLRWLAPNAPDAIQAGHNVHVESSGSPVSHEWRAPQH
jgi:RND superfamily putative drug exporter